MWMKRISTHMSDLVGLYFCTSQNPVTYISHAPVGVFGNHNIIIKLCNSKQNKNKNEIVKFTYNLSFSSYWKIIKWWKKKVKINNINTKSNIYICLKKNKRELETYLDL